MANEQKKINELDPEIHDDTAELEALSATMVFSDAPCESEADAVTDSFESASASSGTEPGSAVAVLKSDLRQRDQSISSLKYDFEHLRARWTGLEKELKVREEITENLTRDLEQARRQLAETRRLLEARDHSIQSLTSATGAQENRLAAANETLEQSRREAAALEQELADQGEQLAALSEELAAAQLLLQENSAQRKDLQNRLDSRELELEALHRQLAEERQANAAMSGRVTSSRDAIARLERQIEKGDSYADALRTKLQQQLGKSESLAVRSNQAETALAEALQRETELAARLEAEQQLNAELQERNDNSQQDLDEEVRRIRHELEVAGATLTRNQSPNEQLAADSCATRGSRQAFDEQPAESDVSHQQELQGLRSQLVQLERQLDEYEHKLTNKDAAINALLSELAGKPDCSRESQGDEVVHLVAERSQEAAPERERVTRFLTGSIDGQELRFPLFKDRLTIGRTAHNDIQLKAHFVSRRHAVILIESDRTRIVDWGSKNGIYVNTTRISDQVLKNGDRVTVGTAEFKFEERAKR